MPPVFPDQREHPPDKSYNTDDTYTYEYDLPSRLTRTHSGYYFETLTMAKKWARVSVDLMRKIRHKLKMAEDLYGWDPAEGTVGVLK